MASSYPGSLDSFGTKVDNTTLILAAHMNDVQNAIVAAQTELGTDPAGSVTDVKTRLAVSLNNDGTLKGGLGNVVMVAKSGGAYATIQAGIDAASSGDTVLVFAGTYTETIILKDGVNIVAVDIDNTVIDGQIYDNAVEVHCYLNINIDEQGGSAYALHSGHSNSVIRVDGDINTNSGYCVAVDTGGSITVNGNISSDSATFTEATISVFISGSITVNGNITGGERGAYANSGGTIIVNGNITAELYAVACTTPGSVTVRGGTITVSGGTPPLYAVYAASGTVTIQDCLIVGAYGIITEGATVILQNCRIDSDTNSIYAVAPQDVSCYDVYGDKVCHSNITNLVANGFKLADGTTTDAESITATVGGVTASLNVTITQITTDGNGGANADNIALADGVAGQEKVFVYEAEGNAGDTAIITPASFGANNTITFDTPGEGCLMEFDGTNWNVVGNNGGAIA